MWVVWCGGVVVWHCPAVGVVQCGAVRCGLVVWSGGQCFSQTGACCEVCWNLLRGGVVWCACTASVEQMCAARARSRFDIAFIFLSSLAHAAQVRWWRFSFMKDWEGSVPCTAFRCEGVCV